MIYSVSVDVTHFIHVVVMIPVLSLLLIFGALQGPLSWAAPAPVKCKNRGSVTAVKSTIYANIKYCCEKHWELTKMIQLHVQKPKQISNCQWRCYFRQLSDSVQPGPGEGQYCKFTKEYPAKKAKDVNRSGCPSGIKVFNEYDTRKGSCGATPESKKCKDNFDNQQTIGKGEPPKASDMTTRAYYCYSKCMDGPSRRKKECLKTEHTCIKEVHPDNKSNVDSVSYFCLNPCACK